MGKASKSSSSSGGGGLRQRKNNKNKNQSSSSSSSSTSAAENSIQQAKDNKDDEPNNNNNNKRRTKTTKHEVEEVDEDDVDDEPAWHVIRRHPAFLAVIFLGIPYLFKLTMTYLILQHPEYLKWLINPEIRRSISMDDPRQLLIVGSMSSGTTQTSYDFQSILQIEIGHEDTDTKWKFCRDGTISWFHSIRFMKSRTQQDIENLCLISWEFYSKDKMNFFQPWSNYGWGPSLFGPQSFDRFHFDPKFKYSFVQSCQQTLSNEFGCGLVVDSVDDSSVSVSEDGGKSTSNFNTSCKTPFQYTLIQTRQPWKIVTSLVSKYCYDSGSSNKNKNKFHLPPKSLIKFLGALFPDDDENDENDDDGIWSMTPLDMSNDENLRICTNQMATYVYRLYTELLDNTQQLNQNQNQQQQQQDKNVVQVQMYPIETTTICDVAKMGGLLDKSTTIYKPNYEVVSRFCQTNSTQLFGSKANQFNRGRLEISQIITIANQSIQMQLLNLHKRMGYTNHPMF